MKKIIYKLCLTLAACAAAASMKTASAGLCQPKAAKALQPTSGTTAVDTKESGSIPPEEVRILAQKAENQQMPVNTVKPKDICGYPRADEQKPERMFIYKKKLYIDTGEVSTAGRCGVMDGKIQKTVSADKIPTKELQSNFGKGYSFQLSASGRRNRLEVRIDDTWHIFAYNENNFEGLSMKVKQNTAKTATLAIKNTTGREVIWGEEFHLEKKNFKTGEWRAVPYTHYDFAFHEIAYYAKKDTEAKWKADWSYIYGKLKPGTYRIVKEFADSKNGWQSEYYTLSAKFRVEAQL